MFRSTHISRSSRTFAVALMVMALATPSAVARPAADPAGSAGGTSVPEELRYHYAYAPAEFTVPEPATPAPAADDDSVSGWRPVIAAVAGFALFACLVLALVRMRVHSPRVRRAGAN